MSQIVMTSARDIRRARSSSTAALVTVLVVAVVLIVGGYGLKVFVTSRTVSVSGAGIVAQAPAGWQIVPNSNELVVRNPTDPQALLAASAIDNAGGATPRDVGQTATGARAQLLSGFQRLFQQAIQLGDRNGFEIRYLYTTGAGSGAGSQVVVECSDLYLSAGTKVIAASYEAPQDRFDSGYAAFERFAASVETTP